MKINFDEQGKRLSEKALSTFGRRLGAELPQDYKDFLLEVNGGTPADDLSFSFVEEGRPSETVLGQFYTLAKASDCLETLDEALETFVNENRMPSWFLPIADDAFGNQVCLSLSEADFGAVYFWNHEKEPDPGSLPITFQNVSSIAPSFNEFLSSLVRVDE